MYFPARLCFCPRNQLIRVFYHKRRDKFKSLLYSSYQCVKVNPNFKRLLSIGWHLIWIHCYALTLRGNRLENKFLAMPSQKKMSFFAHCVCMADSRHGFHKPTDQVHVFLRKGFLVGFSSSLGKVHIFWEGHKILQNLHLTFVLCSASQK